MSISQKALLEDTAAWEKRGAVANGGTVFGLAVSPVPEVQRCWAATGCGVFYSDNQGTTWTQTLSGLTTPLLSTIVAAPSGVLLAGSLDGDLFYSLDYGKNWRAGNVPLELRATVTQLVTSPNFRNDGCAFAATDGAGLLVTRGSGRSWEDSNFGLEDNTILALATSPDWSHRELVFAATTTGVYLSLNGGRSWRESELLLDDDVIDVLVVSPLFEQDHVVFAGTENGSLYRSDNGGRTWDLLNDKIGDGPVNCLWPSPDMQRLIAGVGSQVCVSDDGGETWRLTADMSSSVLSLAGDGQIILAGMHDRGVYKSLDGGETWESASASLAARGYSRLVATESALFVLGPQEGLAISHDDGSTWQPVGALGPYAPLTALYAPTADDLLIASQEAGILRSSDGGATWQVVCEIPGVQSLTLAELDGAGWAGTVDGGLLVTQDGGFSWAPVDSPCSGQEILTIVASPTFVHDHTVLMGTALRATPNQQARVALWRSTNAGTTWRQVTTQVTTARWLDIAVPLEVTEQPAEQAVMATGPFCLRPLRRAKDVWISTRVDPYGANALGVVVVGEIDNGGVMYAATGNGIYRSIDGGRTWQLFAEGLGNQSFISISVTKQGDTQALYALSLGGTLYKHVLA